MSALQANIRTDMDLTDVKALNDWGSKLPDSAIQHFAVTPDNLVDEYFPYTRGSCGLAAAYALCPSDATYKTWQAIFARAFVPKDALAEQAPVQLVNTGTGEVQSKATSVLQQLGLQMGDGVLGRPAQPRTIVYDYSGGRFPATAAWLRDFFGADVEPATPASPGARANPVPGPGQ